MSAAPVQEPQLEAKKDEAVVVVGSGGKGRLSKTNSGPSSGDKDRKLGGGGGGGGASQANNNNNKNSNKRTDRTKSPLGGGSQQAK